MKPKTLTILAALALVLALVAFLTLRTPSTSTSETSQLLFPTLREQAGKVANIRVHRGSVESVLTLAERDSKPIWVLKNHANYPIEVEHVRTLISALAEATILEPKTSKPEL